MKRCPECRRDYFDDSLAYCLDDGAVLLDGPPSHDEPATAILNGTTEPSTKVFSSGNVRADLTEPLAIRRTSNILKGIVAILILILGVGGYFYYVRGTTKQISSIAVMPFVNESGNADVDYLSDGMTETLIGSLSKIANLSVKSRNAVFSYKGKDISAKQVGDELSVQAVLLGRLTERGRNLKLNLELVNAKTSDVIWSEQYDRKEGDLVDLQSEIARDVSGKLRSKLSGEDQQALTKKYTDDPEAYRLYLQARYYLNKRVGKEYEKAEGFLQQALARDPNFALGYTGLAEFVAQRDRPKAKDYILRALAIDNDLSEAHALLGMQFNLDREWASAEREFDRAISLDPNNVHAHHWNATRLMMLGRFDQSLAEIDRAIELEPQLADIRTNRAACLVAAGRVDDSIAEIKKAIEIEPSYAWSYSQLSFLYRMKGDHVASVEARAHSYDLLGQTDVADHLSEAFAKGGWSAYLPELLEQTSGNFASKTRRASILAEMGKKEEAIAALKEAADQGDWWLFSIKYDPAFDGIRSDARFQALVRQFEPPQ